jgi:hypothetical protein
MATALLSTFFRFSSSQPLISLRFERKDFLKKYAKFAGVIALVIGILVVNMPLAIVCVWELELSFFAVTI